MNPLNEAEVDALFADALRYQKLKNLGLCNEKKTGLTAGGNHLKTELSFRYWCSPDKLDELVDNLIMK